MRSLLVLALIGIMFAAVADANPPSPGVIVTGVSNPMQADPRRRTVTNLGATTPIAINATDLADALETDFTIQLTRITNRHATAWVCVGSVAARTGDHCEADCATAAKWTQFSPAALMTCTGAATDGTPFPPGYAGPGPTYDGTRCVCVVSSVASTTATLEQLARQGVAQ